MDDSHEFGMELFMQDGVLLKSGPASYMNDLNTTGKLSIIEYPNSNGSRYLEWKPVDITIDSEIQDQEWAVVNTVGRRTRTLSGNIPPESQNRIVRLNMNDLKSFRVTRNCQHMSFTTKDGLTHSSFFFQHGNSDSLVNALKGLVRTVQARRDKHLYTIVDDPNTQSLDRSFAELNLFTGNTSSDYMWNFVKNFQHRPYEATMEAFSKITDIVYRGPDEQRYADEDVVELLNRSLTQINTSTETHGEYEVVAHVPKPPPLPARPVLPRETPLSQEQWMSFQDEEGRIKNCDEVKKIIFRGGISPPLRTEIWKYLLNYFPWNCTHEERQQIHKKKTAEYFTMKLQWRSMTQAQENNFSDYRERKSLIEKDVNRTDRTVPFYAGENNPHLQLLSDILMTYVMYNFDLGYVQGMSDLLSPILCLMENEFDAFWCFVGFMEKVSRNFDMDQAGMKEQLEQLHCLLTFVDPELANYLNQHDSGNMFFCFRWLLVWFKREFAQHDIMRLWEVLWTDLPCKNFHLLMCIAILDTEKDNLIGSNFGFTEILKHVNNLSEHIELQWTLSKAEGIYQQISTAAHLTNSVRNILGLKLVPEEDKSTETSDLNTEHEQSPPVSLETVTINPDSEVTYERGLELSYL